MRAAVEAFVPRKFGAAGAYQPNSGDPWKNPADVLEIVAPYDEVFVDCMTEIARYVYQKSGTIPGTFNMIVFPGSCKPRHIDTEFYDTHFTSREHI